MKLSVRERKFCQRYHVLGNATEAAKEAGYSAKTAYSQGSRLLKRVEVAKYLAELQGKSEAKGLLVAEDLERRLQEVIDFNPQRLYRPVLENGQPKIVDGQQVYEPIPLPELPEDVARALAGFDVEELFEGASGEKFCVGRLRKWKRWDPARALELAMKRRGMLVDRSEVAVVGPITILTDAPPKDFDK